MTSMRPRILSTALILTTAMALLRPMPAVAAEDQGAYEHSRPIDMPDAVIDTDISPEEAYVYLDGKMVGDADDFDGHPGWLMISPGMHTLEFRCHGYQTLRIEMDARGGRYYELNRKLHKGNSNEIRVENWVNVGH